MKLIVLLLAAIAASSQAQTVGVHLGSHHSSGEFENFNPGLYYRSADGWTGGAYRNSERRWTAYAGFTFEAEFRGWKPALTIGGMYGYRDGDCRDNKPMAWLKEDAPEKCRTRLALMAFPSIATPDYQGYRLRLGYMPKLNRKGAEVFHLMAEREF